MERTFDWAPRFDDRSRAYRSHAATELLVPQSRTWGVPVWLDQGREGACVAFAHSHRAGGDPKRWPVTDASARAVYARAQQIDEWPGTAYSGTSVLAGAKAMVEAGVYASYRWAFGLDDVLRALSYEGPVVLGVSWYEGMFDTDPNGFVWPTGSIAGGHAVCIRGLALSRGYVRIRNSWGESWGVNGDCKLALDALGGLLDGAEACVPVERRRTR